MITKIKQYIQNNKKVSVAVGALLLAVLFFVFRSGGATKETMVVEQGNVVEKVILTGKVKPADEVDLAFDRTGKVATTNTQVGAYVSLGQTLVSLDSSEIYADYLKAQANVASAQARLDELKRGSRPEEIAISQSEVSNATIALANAEDKLKSALYESYAKADDAIHNNVDGLFSNPRTNNPQISVSVNDTQLKNDINLSRYQVENLLALWDQNPGDTSRATIVKITTDLNTIKMFVDKVAVAVNALSANSSLSATTVDGYKTAVSTARTGLISAQSSISTAEEKLNTSKSTLLIAQKNLALKQAGTSVEEINAQEAQVLQYQAQLQAVGAQLAKMTIRAPFAGLVTKQDAKRGEIITAGTAVVSVISGDNLEIEANVSEISVGKVSVGNVVVVTMDAFPGKTFAGRVAYVEPGETIVDGVVNFKIRIIFSESYPEIKTGLSTNLEIVTAIKENVVKVAEYAITMRDGKKYALKKEGKREVEVEVVTGFKGSDGFVEVLSGLSVGDVVVLSSK